MFVVPPLGGIRLESRLKAELRTAHSWPRHYKFVSAAGLAAAGRRRFDTLSTARGRPPKGNSAAAPAARQRDSAGGRPWKSPHKKIPLAAAARPFDSSAGIGRIKASRMTGGGSRAKDAMEVTKDDKEIVSALRSSLAGKVGQDRFDLWFGAATRLDYDGSALRIGVPNRFFLEWIRGELPPANRGGLPRRAGQVPRVGVSPRSGPERGRRLLYEAVRRQACRRAAVVRRRLACTRSRGGCTRKRPHHKTPLCPAAALPASRRSWPARRTASPWPRPRWSSAGPER